MNPERTAAGTLKPRDVSVDSSDTGHEVPHIQLGHRAWRTTDPARTQGMRYQTSSSDTKTWGTTHPARTQGHEVPQIKRRCVCTQLGHEGMRYIPQIQHAGRILALGLQLYWWTYSSGLMLCLQYLFKHFCHLSTTICIQWDERETHAEQVSITRRTPGFESWPGGCSDFEIPWVSSAKQMLG
jgi:hypothetical protein